MESNFSRELEVKSEYSVLKSEWALRMQPFCVNYALRKCYGEWKEEYGECLLAEEEELWRHY